MAKVTKSQSSRGSAVRQKQPAAWNDLTHWRQAKRYYEGLRPKLLRDPAISGRFIAIRDRKIVEIDDSERALARRLFDRFPDHRFFVVQVMPDYPHVTIGDVVIHR